MSHFNNLHLASDEAICMLLESYPTLLTDKQYDYCLDRLYGIIKRK